MTKKVEDIDKQLRELGNSLRKSAQLLSEDDFSRKKKVAINAALDAYEKPRFSWLRLPSGLPAYAMVACAVLAIVSVSSRNPSSTGLSFEEAQFSNLEADVEDFAFNLGDFSEDFSGAFSGISTEGLEIEEDGFGIRYEDLDSIDISEDDSWEDDEYEYNIEEYL